MAKKTLCATDGSHASEKAVAYAIDLVKNEVRCGGEGELIFLIVNTVSDESASHTIFWDDVVIDAADAQVHKELYSAELKAKQAGLTEVKCVAAYGRNIAAVVIDYAEKEEIEHIVTGSTGRTGVARLLLGSVASEIVQKAHCPVTIVR